MGNDISSQLGAYESSVWTAVGTIVGENFALWKTTLRSRHGHTAFRTKARLLGWLSACSLVGQTLGHITSPSASSGSSPATPLPPGCWVLLYLRQAVHGFIGYKSLFSPAHQKKKENVTISWKVYTEGQSILSVIGLYFFCLFSSLRRWKKVSTACQDHTHESLHVDAPLVFIKNSLLIDSPSAHIQKIQIKYSLGVWKQVFWF